MSEMAREARRMPRWRGLGTVVLFPIVAALGWGTGCGEQIEVGHDWYAQTEEPPPWTPTDSLLPRMEESQLDPARPSTPDATWESTVGARIAQEELRITLQEGRFHAVNRATDLRFWIGADGRMRIEPRDPTKAAWVADVAIERIVETGGFVTAVTGEGRLGGCVDPAATGVTGACLQDLEFAGEDATVSFRNRGSGLDEFVRFVAPPAPGRIARLRVQVAGLELGEVVGERMVTFRPEGGADVVVLRVHDAVASSGDAVATELAVLGAGGVDVLLDASPADFPISLGLGWTGAGGGDGVILGMETTPWTIDPTNQASANVGMSVAGAGDVNADGFGDIIVGAPNFDNGSTNEGGAWLFLGTLTGPGASAAWNWDPPGTPDPANANFGWSVASAGDVNRDSYADVIIGAPGFSNGTANEGRLYVFHGGSSSPYLATTPNWVKEGSDAGFAVGSGRLGWSVARAGDVNDDAYGDVIIGAKDCPCGGTNRGGAFVVQGSSTGLSTGTPLWTAHGEQDYDRFGYAVASAGDVTSDGYEDVIVGAPYHDRVSYTDEGRAYVFYATSSGFDTTADWTADGGQAYAHFGWSVAGTGDTTGDGRTDVIVGAPDWDDGTTDGGAVRVFDSADGGLDSGTNWLPCKEAYAHCGYSVAGVGDVNGDGYADVAYAAPDMDAGGTDRGKVWVHQGSSAGVDSTAEWTQSGVTNGDRFGLSVAAAGDVDGDGMADVIVGAPYFNGGGSDEGRAYVYAGTGDGLPGTHNWARDGYDQVSAGLSIVAPAGDFNGDGYNDLVVGTPWWDNGAHADVGRVDVFYGASGGASASPSWTWVGDFDDGRAGTSVDGAGDVNGDGYADLIVGRPRWSNGDNWEGEILIFRGGSTPDTTPDWRREGNLSGDVRLGFWVSAAGDVNGDGYADVIAGMPYYDSGGYTDRGRAQVYHGSGSGIGASPAWTVAGDAQHYAYNGLIVESAGDVNGDGYSDVVVGEPYYDSANQNAGRAVIYLGSSGGVGGAHRSITGANAADFLGYGVNSAGDVNRDGYDDVLISAPWYDGGSTNEGHVFVYHGSSTGVDGTADGNVEVDIAYAGLGVSVAHAGDVNGDGFGDIIAGAYYLSNGHTQEGRAYVFRGSASGVDASNPWFVESNQEGAWFGSCVDAAGDVNGDGFGDVVVGAPFYNNTQTDEGQAFMYYGGGGGGRALIPRQLTPGDDVRQPFYLAGGDDQVRFKVLSNTSAGRTKVRLQWQIKSSSDPFDDLGSMGSQGSWSAGGGLGPGYIAETVTGTSNGHWQWRVRLLYLGFGWSPWMVYDRTGVWSVDFRTPP